MAPAFELAPDFGWVIATAVGSWAIHHGYMSTAVMAARTKYGVRYPILYASADDCKDEVARKTFNCVQRAHQNSLENQPIFLTLLLLGGLKYPLASAGLGAIYLGGRIAYFLGYSTGTPGKRRLGLFMYIGLLGLVGTCVRVAIGLIASK